LQANAVSLHGLSPAFSPLAWCGVFCPVVHLTPGMENEMTTYAEKLRDPRWQRLRLEVMQRAKFKCENCWDSETNLQIHHPAYKIGANPWDYDKSELLCYCEECHKAATKAQKKFKAMAFTNPAKFAELMEMISDGVLDAACDALVELIAEHAKKNKESIGVYFSDHVQLYSTMHRVLFESGGYK
jgi:Zn finger protein HypA/HybF involved in hydrogenase expression